MILNGADFELNVEDPANPGTYIPVADMNSLSKSSERDSNTFPVFQRNIPYRIYGNRDQTYDAGGYLSPGDPGQTALFDAERNNTTINIQVLFDGTNGFTQEVNVGSYSYDVAPDEPQEIGFEFAAAADAVMVGTGPLL